MTENKESILVVDDEEIIRSGCQEILELNGYNVDLAVDGEDGLKKIKKNDYDLVLTDIMMPKMDGMELLEEIKKSGKEPVTIVITGYATIENAIDAGRKGAFDYIPKPFNPDEMLAKVERGLKQHQHLHEVAKLREEHDRNLLECSNERARTLTIINSMSEGVIATNRQNQLVLMNPMAMKMLHLKDRRVIGDTVDKILKDEELIKTISTSLDNVISSLNAIRLEFDTADGRVLQANITPIIDEHKECIGTVTVLIDITEGKKVEKMKSDFVKYVSHELKAPLGAIEGYLDLILEGITADNPEKGREMIQRSRDRAEELINLINDLLDLSRVDRKKSTKEMKPTDIRPLLKETIDFYQSEAREKSIAISLVCADNLEYIRGNEEDLARLFSNLVSNAIKYTSENGKVEIRANRTNSHIKVDIRDTGMGISKQALANIFDEFYRAENVLQQKISGTGLGLSIAKKIAEDHHGDIEVQSKENEGSTFTVTFPILEE